MKSDARLAFDTACKQQQLVLPEGYFDILRQVANRLSAVPKTKLLVGLGGSQGSGKSTFASLLAEVMSAAYETSSVVLSLDDFYLPKSERRLLADKIPLLETRGVPGTHDLDACMAAVDAFKSSQEVRKPNFSKSDDDRMGYSQIKTEKAQLLIFEGWCWGALPQSEALLVEPVNELESKEDSDGRWRQYVNERLIAYQALFVSDLTIFLKSPNLQAVREWRHQQESALQRPKSKREIDRFVQYFERISLDMIKRNPELADICIDLDSQHRLTLTKLN